LRLGGFGGWAIWVRGVSGVKGVSGARERHGGGVVSFCCLLGLCIH